MTLWLWLWLTSLIYSLLYLFVYLFTHSLIIFDWWPLILPIGGFLRIQLKVVWVIVIKPEACTFHLAFIAGLYSLQACIHYSVQMFLSFLSVLGVLPCVVSEHVLRKHYRCNDGFFQPTLIEAWNRKHAESRCTDQTTMLQSPSIKSKLEKICSSRPVQHRLCIKWARKMDSLMNFWSGLSFIKAQ